MNSLHDYNIYSIEINCGACQIVFQTNLVDGENSDEKEIEFTGVIGHRFNNVLDGNIIFNIAEETPEDFYKSEKSFLQNYEKFGLRLNCTNLEHFSNSLHLNGVSIFRISSSYGLNGWIIAKKMKITPKA
jgi:hypothetical protein